MNVTEAQKRATAKYNNKNYDNIHLRVAKGDKEKYKALAESKGKSLNQLIVELLQNELKK